MKSNKPDKQLESYNNRINIKGKYLATIISDCVMTVMMMVMETECECIIIKKKTEIMVENFSLYVFYHREFLFLFQGVVSAS